VNAAVLIPDHLDAGEPVVVLVPLAPKTGRDRLTWKQLLSLPLTSPTAKANERGLLFLLGVDKGFPSITKVGPLGLLPAIAGGASRKREPSTRSTRGMLQFLDALAHNW
jgi:hypothetical protein